jgi:hypothetical protein
LIGDWDICASYAYGFQFDQSVGEYVQKLKWDEAFCAKTKMPLCMIDLMEESQNCTVMGVPISTGVLEYDCDTFSYCLAGNLTTDSCIDGFKFSNNETFMGGCLDARDVPECDVDECALWDNGELDQDGNSYCPENTVSCNNLIGTHNCTCDDGLYFENQGNYWNYSNWECVDVDECLHELDNCNENSVCQNSFGGFWCLCNEGYYIEDDGSNQCIDYDECLDGVYYYQTDHVNNFTNSGWPPQDFF